MQYTGDFKLPEAPPGQDLLAPWRGEGGPDLWCLSGISISAGSSQAFPIHSL
jgi:hypothetical protein